MINTAQSSRLEQHTWGYHLRLTSNTMTTPPTLLNLPLDLQFMILDQLPLSDYVSLALAGYHGLHSRHAHLFPAVTRNRLRMMRTLSPGDPYGNLPNEMIENVVGHMDRKSLMGWVMAHYQTLATSNPPLVPRLTGENMRQLYLSWLRLDGGT